MDETRIKVRVGEWSEVGAITVESCVRWCRGALKNGPRTLRDCVLSMGMDIDLQEHVALVSNALDHLVDLGVAVRIGDKYHDDTGIKRPRVDIIPKAIGTPRAAEKKNRVRPPKEKKPRKPPPPRQKNLFSKEDILGFIEMVRSGMKQGDAIIKMGANHSTVYVYVRHFGLNDMLESVKAESLINRNKKDRVYANGRIVTFEEWKIKTQKQREKRELAKQNKTQNLGRHADFR